MTRRPPSQILVHLNRKRLVEAARAARVELPTKGRKQELLQTFDALPENTLRETLRALTAVELRRLCRQAGLDDSGQVDRLYDRLLDHEKPIRSTPSTLRVPVAEPSLPMQQNPWPEGQLGQAELENLLWEAANILRGTIDSSDYRKYIFALLFYKRLSDVWEEEFEAQLPADAGTDSLLGGQAVDPPEHRFQISRELLWTTVCGGREQGLGRRLNAALRAIEEANPRLLGLFQDVDFAHRERFPDATLERLVRHFDSVRLRNADVTLDVFGDAYEFLIAQFADDAGKKGGEFYTPKMVVRLLVECLNPRKKHSVYDPACGSGGMLLGALEHVRRYYKEDPRRLRLFGQERNLNTWGICQMNLLLHNIDDASVKKGDTLRSPQHLNGGRGLMRFDRVLANPPFSLKAWGHEIWREGDPYQRDVYGCPPERYGDLAFLQHMLASLGPEGMMGVVLPHGVLFRGKAEGRIRRGLLKDDLVEAILGLPSNLFYGTTIPACVWILNRAKKMSRKGKVLFVDGSQEMKQGTNQNHLSEENVARLRQAFESYADEEGFSRVVDLEEIAARSYNLHIPLYVAPPMEELRVDIPATLLAMRELERKVQGLQEEIEAQVRELGY